MSYGSCCSSSVENKVAWNILRFFSFYWIHNTSKRFSIAIIQVFQIFHRTWRHISNSFSFNSSICQAVQPTMQVMLQKSFNHTYVLLVKISHHRFKAFLYQGKKKPCATNETNETKETIYCNHQNIHFGRIQSNVTSLYKT